MNLVGKKKMILFILPRFFSMSRRNRCPFNKPYIVMKKHQTKDIEMPLRLVLTKQISESTFI